MSHSVDHKRKFADVMMCMAWLAAGLGRGTNARSYMSAMPEGPKERSGVTGVAITGWPANQTGYAA